MRREKAFTLVEVIVVVIVIVVLVALLLPALNGGRHPSYQCGNNLRQAYTAMRAITVDKTPRPGQWPIPGGTMKDGTTPVGAGREWWEMVYTSGEVEDNRLLCCDISETAQPGRSSYWGPLTDPNTAIADDMILGMDAIGNHAEEDPLNVILKGGDMQQVMVADLNDRFPGWRRHVGP